MDLTYIFQLILLCSFLIVSVAFAIKLVVETYLNWLEVKEGITLFKQQIELGEKRANFPIDHQPAKTNFLQHRGKTQFSSEKNCSFVRKFVL